MTKSIVELKYRLASDSIAKHYRTRPAHLRPKPRFLPSLFPSPPLTTAIFSSDRRLATFSQTTCPSAPPGVKGVRAITAELATYFKKAFEDATRVLEQLVGVKSVEQAFGLTWAPAN